MTTIMIVEDEPLIREIGAEVLMDAGYDVIEAEDADEAMDILEHGSTIALLFTDIRMPGPMDGIELATRVHGRWPTIRLLLTSGHVDLSDDELPDHGAFIAKPYRWTQLTQQIERLLITQH
ncbi:response regulator [Sphingobium sufflavum]|uniref:response regulator n=1 Tax=Sphingobium sufflavum TaxID=1129547 RepID=UPI001F2E5D5B|nr:response regulator [Sphingobium sufflavum]MCE7796698.1 response regulator [Sphingobium sufflavum]